MSRKTVLLSLLSLFLVIPMSKAAPALAADTPQVIFLYPPGSPTLKGSSEKEILDPPNPKPGEHYSIKNVHNPLIEIHLPPAEKSTGAALVVAPGGGHSQLVWFSEGQQIAEWLNQLGIAAVILKYRLAQTPGYKYTVEGEAAK